MDFPIDQVRARFPALARGAVFFDAPGGTQVCRPAIDRMVAHMAGGTANSGGAFATSREADALSAAAREGVADLLGARADEVAFGPNMTTLTFCLSRALARGWDAGDELVVTRLDHDANVSPWLQVAADRGMAVRWLDFDPGTGRLRLDALPGLLGARTRMVALGGASNALGTVNDVATMARAVRERSDALVFVDGVQLVPHVAVDVAALGCDFLAWSPYKMFGPHQGVLWARGGVLDGVEAYKVRPADAEPGPHRFETGTPSFEGQAGTLGVIDYLDWLGGEAAPGANGRPERLRAAMAASAAYEHGLATRMLEGLARVDGLRLHGPATAEGRVPTFAFTVRDLPSRTVAERLAAAGIHAWSGHFYAVEVLRRLGLEVPGLETRGLVRVGLCHYATADEVDRLTEALATL